jgi:hypothetical protein
VVVVVVGEIHQQEVLQVLMKMVAKPTPKLSEEETAWLPQGHLLALDIARNSRRQTPTEVVTTGEITIATTTVAEKREITGTEVGTEEAAAAAATLMVATAGVMVATETEEGETETETKTETEMMLLGVAATEIEIEIEAGTERGTATQEIGRDQGNARLANCQGLGLGCFAFHQTTNNDNLFIIQSSSFFCDVSVSPLSIGSAKFKARRRSLPSQ